MSTNYINNDTTSTHAITRRTFLLGAAALLAPNPALAAETPAQARYANVPASFVAKRIRVHIVKPIEVPYQDAIAIELVAADGSKRFVLIDGGVGPTTGLPHDGYTNRYSKNSPYSQIGIVSSYEHMMGYLCSIGVADGNVAFYLGSHPHFDHMGASAEIIQAFRPPVFYTPEYSDDFLRPSTSEFVNYDGEVLSGQNLEDCQYNYDRAIAAAQAAGTEIVTSIDGAEDATFTFGGVRFTIVNWDHNYRELAMDKRCGSPNYFSWGLLVEGCGRRMFFGADITYYDGTEQRLAQWIGEVDLFKMNHHGFAGSNCDSLIGALNPKIAVHTSREAAFYYNPKLADLISGIRLFSTHDCNVHGFDAVVVTLSESELSCNLDSSVTGRQEHGYQLLFADGRFAEPGWHEYAGGHYYCTGLNEYGCSVFSKGLQTIEDKLYCINENGRAITGWWQDPDDGRWYYFEPSGAGAKRWVYGNGTPFLIENGKVVVGWIPYGGNWYYLHEDYRWARSELLELEGKTYGFDASGKAIANGWLILDGAYYHFDGSGRLERDTWISYGGHWYYLGSDGAVVTDGEASYEGKTYWMGPNGRVVKEVTQAD